MSLQNEINSARTEIVTDGYDMSIGEVINLYRDNELTIAPEFQRLFRWDISRKTRFIESILLGIPIPPIFVFQRDDGVWELIDGLQRLSTIYEFVGILKDNDNTVLEKSVMEGTRFLPSLTGVKWEKDGETDTSLSQAQRIEFKRARIRIEILKKESDQIAKYELFQRLNTGGAGLSEQEVRNCVAVMINPKFYRWTVEQAENLDFLHTINQTESALVKQMAVELVLRFLAFRNVHYKNGLDVHEYLDDALISLANNGELDLDAEKDVFDKTFKLLRNALGDVAFKRWNGEEFKGKFLMSVFEVVGKGVSMNVDAISSLSDPVGHINQLCQDLWSNETFIRNSGAGVRGTTRLANLLPMANDYFKP
ncbi:MAG: hypothetical protein ACI9SP_004362 [Arenicella sp.]|jgi:hypothetical protein